MSAMLTNATGRPLSSLDTLDPLEQPQNWPPFTSPAQSRFPHFKLRYFLAPKARLIIRFGRASGPVGRLFGRRGRKWPACSSAHLPVSLSNFRQPSANHEPKTRTPLCVWGSYVLGRVD